MLWYFVFMIFSMDGAGVAQIGPYHSLKSCNEDRRAIMESVKTYNKATPCKKR